MIENSVSFSSFQVFYLSFVSILQILALISSVLSIRIVLKWRKTSRLIRPKVFMSNIAVSDCLLITESLIFKFILVPLLHYYGVDPTASHIAQSVNNYIDCLTRYLTALFITALACDRYYGLVKVFYNPFDHISTIKIVAMFWIFSLIFSTPFIVTTSVYRYDYTNKSMVCFDSCLYLKEFSGLFFKITRIFRLITQFFIPTLFVSYLTIRIVYQIVFRSGSIVGITLFNPNEKAYQRAVTKRVLLVLVIFIGRSISFYSYEIPLYLKKTLKICNIKESYIHHYLLNRTMASFNSSVYFWLSSDFRREVFNIFKNIKQNPNEQHFPSNIPPVRQRPTSGHISRYSMDSVDSSCDQVSRTSDSTVTTITQLDTESSKL